MEEITNAPALIVQQKKEWGEILTGFETKNRYAILDPQGQDVGKAAEESNTFARLFLKLMRPFTMHILSNAGQPVFRIKKPFRFYFHEATVEDAAGKYLGRITREFSLFQRNFSVVDNLGQEIFKVSGPFLHPWTFNILKNGMEMAKITKKWSGLGKEMFSDADTFSVDFGAVQDPGHKEILLGALFLIDMLFFEQK